MRTSIVVASALLMTSGVVAQLRFSTVSKLSDSATVERSIKNISDEELFSALRTDVQGLQEALASARVQEMRKAYELWGTYWSSKQQPAYITQDRQFLLDTEMLRSYEAAKRYASKHPEQRDSILARAALLKRNIVRTWGDVVVEFGSDVDFNREIGQSAKYGFHYWSWSRPLLTAYLLTEDQSYLAKFDEYFHRWYVQRNSITRGFPELDVVYYELGLGTRNRVFIEYYLFPFKTRSWQTHERLLKTFLGAARWLYELEQHEGYRPGNWQIHGSYMLAQIALVFPEFKESDEWLRIALQRLQEHLERDFFEDGGHSERAPRNYTLATYLCFRNLSELLTSYKVPGDLPNKIRQRTGATIDWWITMITPTGEVPAINDSHRGLFPTFVLEDGADIFQKPYVVGVLKNIFGSRSVAEPVELPSYTSRNMPASGFSIMRTNWSRDALYMNINYGAWQGGHTHYDLLDFEIYAYGEALAVDAGIGLTYDDPLYIPWYRSSRAHNMVTVNDENIDREHSKGTNIVWSSGTLLDYFSGEHDGYAKKGIRHQRQIVFVKPHYWIVMDDVKCEKGGDTLSWYLHTPSALEKTTGGFKTSSAPGLSVMPLMPYSGVRFGKGMAASTADVTPGKTASINWMTLDQLTVEGSSHRFAVLLAPYRRDPDAVKAIPISNTHVRIEGPGFVDDLFVSPHLLGEGGVETDARCLLIHRLLDGKETASIVEGTYMKLQGVEVWRSEARTSTEIELTKKTVK